MFLMVIQVSRRKASFMHFEISNIYNRYRFCFLVFILSSPNLTNQTESRVLIKLVCYVHLFYFYYFALNFYAGGSVD